MFNHVVSMESVQRQDYEERKWCEVVSIQAENRRAAAVS